MDCPHCAEPMEREDGLEPDGLCRPLIPAATYACELCGYEKHWNKRDGYYVTFDPQEENEHA